MAVGSGLKNREVPVSEYTLGKANEPQKNPWEELNGLFLKNFAIVR